MQTPKQCQRCGAVNTPTASRCDCGAPLSTHVKVNPEILLRSASTSPVTRRDVGFGLVALFAAVLGAISGFATTAPWYRLLVVGLFLLASANSFLVRKHWTGLAWILHGLGFVIGFYLFGRWGILAGLGAAFVIATPLVNIFEQRVLTARVDLGRQPPANLRVPKLEILSPETLLDPESFAMLADYTMSAPAAAAIRPDPVLLPVGGRTYHYTPIAEINQACQACGVKPLLAATVRRSRWHRLSEEVADLIHCPRCGAYTRARPGVAMMLFYYGERLDQVEWLGRRVDVADLLRHGRPLEAVLLEPSFGESAV